MKSRFVDQICALFVVSFLIASNLSFGQGIYYVPPYEIKADYPNQYRLYDSDEEQKTSTEATQTENEAINSLTQAFIQSQRELEQNKTLSVRLAAINEEILKNDQKINALQSDLAALNLVQELPNTANENTINTIRGLLDTIDKNRVSMLARINPAVPLVNLDDIKSHAKTLSGQILAERDELQDKNHDLDEEQKEVSNQITINCYGTAALTATNPPKAAATPKAVDISDLPIILIEAKIISIDTSNDRTIGVQIGGGDRQGGRQLFAFSHFGFSEEGDSLKNGIMTLSPGAGLNGALLDPDIADVIIRGLSQSVHVKVESTPRIVVKHGVEGKIASSIGVPYSKLLIYQNAESATTQELAGFSQAGTGINVTAHKIEKVEDTTKNNTTDNGPKIHMDFEIKVLNHIASQTKDKDDNLPPSVHADSIKSTVIVPDGYTLIVGGLNRYGIRKEETGIPFLCEVPLLKHIASNQQDIQSRNTLFVFLTARCINKDDMHDKYEFLKYADVTSINHSLNLCPLE